MVSGCPGTRVGSSLPGGSEDLGSATDSEVFSWEYVLRDRRGNGVPLSVEECGRRVGDHTTI